MVASTGGGLELGRTGELQRCGDSVRALDMGADLVVGGNAVVQQDIVRSVSTDGPRATIVAAAHVFRPFVGALLWAVVLSVLMWPVYARLRRRFSTNFSSRMATLVPAGVAHLPVGGMRTVVGLQVFQLPSHLDQ